MAHITIHGSLDSHPILHTSAGDRKITEIRVIETVRWRDAQGASETREAGCYTVFLFGTDAEHGMRLHKGDKVLVEGEFYVDTSIDVDERGGQSQVSALHIGVSLDSLAARRDTPK